jgi:hypothetical protein
MKYDMPMKSGAVMRINDCESFERNFATEASGSHFMWILKARIGSTYISLENI